jgi:single-strand DNA-binding protein
MNHVLLYGHVGRDPEMKTTPNGTVVTTLSMATNETYTKDGTKHERTEWHNLVAFAKLAETVSKWVRKGNRLLVSGKIQTRSWEDKQGEKKYRTEIVCTAVTFVDRNDAPKADAQQAAQAADAGPTGPATASPTTPDDDYPF